MVTLCGPVGVNGHSGVSTGRGFRVSEWPEVLRVVPVVHVGPVGDLVLRGLPISFDRREPRPTTFAPVGGEIVIVRGDRKKGRLADAQIFSLHGLPVLRDRSLRVEYEGGRTWDEGRRLQRREATARRSCEDDLLGAHRTGRAERVLRQDREKIGAPGTGVPGESKRFIQPEAGIRPVETGGAVCLGHPRALESGDAELISIKSAVERHDERLGRASCECCVKRPRETEILPESQTLICLRLTRGSWQGRE